jgi:4'-phosphopantetheinyl transferase EntD
VEGSETRWRAADPIAHWLSRVAPTATATACGSIGRVAAFAEEEAAFVAKAVARRRNEFLTGRALARLALAELGCPPRVIPVSDARLPLWPEGYVGSISHCADLCLAHVGRRASLLALGVDLEQSHSVTPELLDQICTPAEWSRLTSAAQAGDGLGTLIFSAKEAFYKAYFPIARTFLDFADVTLDVDWPSGAFEASLVSDAAPDIAGQRRFSGRFAQIGPFVVTAVWIAASGPTAGARPPWSRKAAIRASAP